MKKIYSQVLIFLITASFCFSQPTNINLSNTPLFGGEPYLAVNPANHQNIVVAWMTFDVSTNFRMSIKSKVSFDGGAIWGDQFIQPHFGTTWHSADVSLQFRPNGTVYLSYIDYHQTPDSGGVYITHSTNGGITWTTPTQIWNALTEDPTKRPLDRPWLSIDNSGTVNDGMFYLTSKPAPWILPPNRPYLKTSSDSGQTWSAYRYIDTANYLVGNIIAAPMGSPAVTADGALCVAYPSYLSSQSIFAKYYLAKSYNQGASFQYYDLLVNPVGVMDTLYKLGYRLAANPFNANQLAFAFISNLNGDADIFLTTTDNGGLTWNTPVRVNDDLIANGRAQDMVWVNYYNNKLAVTWRDRRNGTGIGFYQSSDTYCAVSINNGSTFQTNIRLSNITAPFDSILEKSGNDFLSSELLNDTIYSAWGDVRTGHLNIFFTKTSDSSGTGTGIISVDKNETELFSINPNPVKDKLVISFFYRQNKRIELKVFNYKGEEVLSTQIVNTLHQITLDVSHLEVGNYFVSASEDNKINFSQKIIIYK